MSTQVEQPVAVAKKRKRGRETALDMVRSLGLVILVIVPVWFLAKAPASDEAEIRVVDPAPAIDSFAADAPTAPVPTGLPEQWRPTSSTYDGAATSLRVGWVTPSQEYAEYAAANGAGADFVERTVGEGAERLEPLVVDGAAWQLFRDADGSLSLTRSYGEVAVVLGTTRATAGRGELEVLLRSLTTR